MKSLSKTKVVLGFLIGACTISYMFYLANSSLQKFVLDAKDVLQVYEYSSNISNIVRIENKLDAAEKQFLLISKLRNLERYRKIKSELLRLLDEVKKISDHELESKILNYEKLLTRKISFYEKTINERKHSLNKSIQILLTGKELKISRKIDTQYIDLISEIKSRIQEKVKRARQRSQETKKFLRNASAAGIIFFVFLGIILFLDVIKRQKYEVELEDAKRNAIRSSQFKSEFLSNMSHEIRTPLNSIIGLTEVLESTTLNKEQERYVLAFKRAGDSLLRIVNDILDLSKVEAGELNLHAEEFELTDIVNDVQSILQIKADEKKIKLVIENRISPDSLYIGDSTRIQQVLINLVSNSIKFTKTGSVKLKLEEKRQGIRFSVIDTGLGIPKEKIKNIFTPFKQADDFTFKKFGGTGLGLSISQKLVELMGGEIKVYSKVNKGSCFYFYLPLKKSSKTKEKMKSKLEITHDNIILNSSILVADDVIDNQNLIYFFLKSYNVKCMFAGDGAQAVQLYMNNHFDLILMDVQMPTMDGLQATQIIRKYEADKKSKRTPIIALTAQAFIEEQQKCIDSGCDHHLVKPIKKDILITGIINIMNQRSNYERQENT